MKSTDRIIFQIKKLVLNVILLNSPMLLEAQCVFEENLKAAGLIDIHLVSKDIKVELKYSGTDNFLGKDIYGCLETGFLQPETAKKLKVASDFLKKSSPELQLIVYDAARPSWVQQALWDNIQKPENVKHVYVAHPKKGSIHNYGAAVDLTLATRDGKALDMGTPYDFFGLLAQPRCETKFLKTGELTRKQYQNRLLLRNVMLKAGFTMITSEWWHFNGCSLSAAKKKYKKL